MSPKPKSSASIRTTLGGRNAAFAIRELLQATPAPNACKNRRRSIASTVYYALRYKLYGWVQLNGSVGAGVEVGQAERAIGQPGNRQFVDDGACSVHLNEPRRRNT